MKLNTRMICARIYKKGGAIMPQNLSKSLGKFKQVLREIRL